MKPLVLVLLGVSLVVAAFAQGRTDIPFQVIDRGANSGEKEQGVKVLRTERAFEEFLKDKGEEQAKKLSKQVDWQTEQVVVVFGGQQNSGGFSVDVKKVVGVDIQRFLVEAVLNKPNRDRGVTMALTTPYIIIKTQRQVGAVKVKFATD